MSIEEIERAIVELPSNKVSELIAMLAEHSTRLWDKQIEDEVDSGSLDSFLAEVDKEYEAELAQLLNRLAMPRFWQCYQDLPKSLQEHANYTLALLKADPHCQFLGFLDFKKIGKRRQLWSICISEQYRALGIEKPTGAYWFWIGSHLQYTNLVWDWPTN